MYLTPVLHHPSSLWSLPHPTLSPSTPPHSTLPHSNHPPTSTPPHTTFPPSDPSVIPLPRDPPHSAPFEFSPRLHPTILWPPSTSLPQPHPLSLHPTSSDLSHPLSTLLHPRPDLLTALPPCPPPPYSLNPLLSPPQLPQTDTETQ